MRQVRWRMVIVGVATAAALMAAWLVTRDRSAWQRGSPAYVGVDRGSLVVLSSVWDRPFGRAENDLCVLMTPRLGVMKIGTRTDAAGAAPLWGVFVPLWVPGLAACAVVAVGVRGRWAEGCCRGCGYSLAGAGPVCPECGRGD